VLHLAAATGRASRAEHWRVNAEGTRALLDACRAAGVPRFLFVSSVAAGFPDIRHYPYAQAKVAAEEAVRASGLRFAIARPAMIFGPGSPIQAALETLASAPVVPVFGHGRTRVQPVWVDDVAASLAGIVEQDRFAGETIGIGGPEVLSIEELLQRMRERRTGRRGRIAHVPLGLVLPPLRIAEALAIGHRLPISIGQLATFRFDGVVGRDSRDEAAPARPLAAMLAAGPTGGSSSHGVLERECRVFTRHVLRADPTAYVVGRYVDAHEIVPAYGEGSRFDRALVAFAARHPVTARLADSFARVFAPASTLRRKLILLLALLETSAPAWRTLDAPPAGGAVRVLARLAASGAASLVSLIVGTVLLLPLRLVLGAPAPRTR
jgi:hypothetical protein